MSHASNIKLSDLNKEVGIKLNHLMLELIRHYFDEEVYMEAVPFGLTNYSKVITVNNNKYIARIYNPHSKDLESLKFEIELITYLEQQKLSFEVPGFINSKAGHPYVSLSSGQYGAVMKFIEGEVPNLSQAPDLSEYGRVVGELSVAFKEFKSEKHSRILTFYDLYNLHPLSNEKSINHYFEHLPFEIEHNVIIIIKETIQDVLNKTNILKQLPKQMIHHDILIFNLLFGSKDKRMNGVLDFDFASNDIRALELAICISHIVQYTNGSFEALELFLNAYSEYMSLSIEEIESIPLLIKMYYAALICIYIGQFYSGQKIESYFNVIVNQFLIMRQWMENHEITLSECIKSKLL